MIRDQNPRPDDTPVRPCSVDRWSGRNHDVSASAKQSGQPLNSRSRQHQSRVASQSDVKHTGLVERGEWPGVNREPRSISVSTADYIRARFDGCRSNLTYLCGDEIHWDELTGINKDKRRHQVEVFPNQLARVIRRTASRRR
ncbi:hypothetical protein FGIG_03922 [Fasciola gigantica]|uniref:Uncharacterized protein n=1 Tax=Fasciola gigantica TaxID=46835 RepID=A0A504Z0C4_FASGI|nr:hypothetical protein FGIG_03922 [Fasciola gigantica]